MEATSTVTLQQDMIQIYQSKINVITLITVSLI